MKTADENAADLAVALAALERIRDEYKGSQCSEIARDALMVISEPVTIKSIIPTSKDIKQMIKHSNSCY